MVCSMATSTRLELRVAPISGRDYSVIGRAAAFIDIPQNDLDPQSAQFAFHASFRGCCYNPLTKLLLVCDPTACCVRTFDVEIRSDTELVVLPRGQIGERGSGAGKFQCPIAVDVSSRGDIAVADFKLNRVAFFTGSGNALHYFGKTGTNRGEFRGISDLRFTLLGHVAVVDSENHRVQVMTTTGGLVLVIGRQGSGFGEFSSPCAVDIARNGDLFVCDGGNKRIQRFNAKGKWLAAWGSKRDRRLSMLPPGTPQYDVNNLPILSSPLRSVFETPCDLMLGLNGEVFVCDAGTQDVFVFSDIGTCLHVVSMPYKPTWSPVAICSVRNSLVVATRKAGCALLSSLTPLQEHFSDHKLLVLPPPEKIPVGKLTLWPWATLLHTVSFLTYADAINVRLVNHILHRACRVLRNEWKLFPLVPGSATVMKYNKVQQVATGRTAVEETFHKWGLRIFKPANRIRRHVMDFDAGFRNAVSSLFGPMFFFQHEHLLREIFRFYSTARDKLEIDEAAFLEIVTQIEEVRAGFLRWPQCPPFRKCSQIPPIRTAESDSAKAIGEHTRSSEISQLQLVENAQQHQLNRLLVKLRSL